MIQFLFEAKMHQKVCTVFRILYSQNIFTWAHITKTFWPGDIRDFSNLGSVSRRQISKYGYLPALTTQVKIFDYASMSCLSGEESRMLWQWVEWFRGLQLQVQMHFYSDWRVIFDEVNVNDVM